MRALAFVNLRVRERILCMCFLMNTKEMSFCQESANSKDCDYDDDIR